MKENKKLETTNTEIVAQTPLIQITDNRREITELTDAEIKEIEKELEQYDKDSWQYSKYLEKFKHIGGEIPKDVPFTEYSAYIHQNFRNPKPRKEWTARDYKVEAAKRTHLLFFLPVQQTSVNSTHMYVLKYLFHFHILPF